MAEKPTLLEIAFTDPAMIEYCVPQITAVITAMSYFSHHRHGFDGAAVSTGGERYCRRCGYVENHPYHK